MRLYDRDCEGQNYDFSHWPIIIYGIITCTSGRVGDCVVSGLSAVASNFITMHYLQLVNSRFKLILMWIISYVLINNFCYTDKRKKLISENKMKPNKYIIQKRRYHFQLLFATWKSGLENRSKLRISNFN